MLFGPPPETTRGNTWFFEAGERRLFDMPGLGMSHLRVGVTRGRASLLVSTVVLTSPVGRETLINVEPVYWDRRGIGFSAGANLHGLTLNGYPGSHFLGVSARMFARPFDDLVIGYAAENFRVSGEDLPGMETALYVALTPGAPLAGVAHVRLDRGGNMASGVGVLLRVRRALDAALGYEGETGAFSAAVSFRWTRLGLDIGTELHPVLGLSKTLFVSFRSHR
jgi:hypothetical protein